MSLTPESYAPSEGMRIAAPLPCRKGTDLFVQPVAVRAAMLAMNALAREGHYVTATLQQDIVRLRTIMETLAQQQNSLRDKDAQVLQSHRREKDHFFRDGMRFYENTLPKLRPQLRCLTMDDYAMVRKLRIAAARSQASEELVSKIVRDNTEWAQKRNPQILSGALAQFFANLDMLDQPVGLDQFFAKLEKIILQHVRHNPLYFYVDWSHGKRVEKPDAAETVNLLAGLEKQGFSITQDFEHDPNAFTYKTTLHQNDSIWILFSGARLFTPKDSELKEDVSLKWIVLGMWPYFVDACQKFLLDPRIARIRNTSQVGSTLGIDAILDELAIAEVSPDRQARPLMVYKLAKQGEESEEMEPELELDARNFPSYECLLKIVPTVGSVKLFANAEAPDDEIDFGIAYHAPNGKIYIITANDTNRTLLMIVKILKNDLFQQTIGAFNENCLAVFEQSLRALGQIRT